MNDAARYLRQMMLPEIGEGGQRRIAASTARVGGTSLAESVAEQYARAAGFGVVEAGPVDVDALAPVEVVRSPGARSVFAGARGTLAVLRSALGTSGNVR